LAISLSYIAPPVKGTHTLTSQHQLHRLGYQQLMVTRFAASSTRGRLSAAKGSSATVSRSDIRLIQHLGFSAHGLVRRWRLAVSSSTYLLPAPPVATRHARLRTRESLRLVADERGFSPAYSVQAQWHLMQSTRGGTAM
jgi:hypothetical protein